MSRIARILALCGCALVPIASAAFIPLDVFIKPPSIILLCAAMLLAVLAGPRLIGHFARDRAFQILGVFIGLAVISSAWGLAEGLPELKGSSPGMATIKAWVSLGMGIATYAAMRAILPQPGVVLATERALLAGMTVSVVIAVLQWAGIQSLGDLMRWLALNVSGARNMLEPGQQSRGYGLAPEPSLFASQLSLIALPILLGRVAAGGAVMEEFGRLRLGRISLPLAVVGLLVVCVGLGISRSRGGLVEGGAACAGAVASVWWCHRRLPDCMGLWRRTLLAATLGVLAMGALALSHGYMRQSLAALGERDMQVMASSAGAQSRWGAWVAAAHTAGERPIMGCGLGLAPWGVVRHLPSWCIAGNPEVDVWLDTAPGALPNAKNMWLRLAAETGLLGLSAWVLFLAWHLRRGLFCGIRPAVLTGAAAGALLIDGLSLDSFALPSMWIVLALIATPEQPPVPQSACAAS